jgi:hypothetical protein
MPQAYILVFILLMNVDFHTGQAAITGSDKRYLLVQTIGNRWFRKGRSLVRTSGNHWFKQAAFIGSDDRQPLVQKGAITGSNKRQSLVQTSGGY